MAKNESIIAIWLACDIEIAKATEAETFPTEGLQSIGIIKARSTTLESKDGDLFTLRKTGGKTIDAAKQEGGFELTTTVIEPSTLYKTFGLSNDDYDETGRMKVKTHVIEDRYAVRLSPKRLGSIGIEAPLCQVSFKPQGSEQEGTSAKVVFKFLFGKAGYWYERFRKKWNNLEQMLGSCYGLGIWIPENTWQGKIAWIENEETELTERI